ncbi:hypothetical protein CSKR_108301, partial [Clonorchis sinensis]
LVNLAVSQPSCNLRVAWQLGTERVLQLNEDNDHPPPTSTGTFCHFPRCYHQTWRDTATSVFQGCIGHSFIHSAVATFWCLAAMPPEGSTSAGILPGCPGLDRRSRDAEIGFESQTFRSCITYIHVSRHLEYRSNWNMRRPGAAHSVAWKHHKREIQLGFRINLCRYALIPQEGTTSNFGKSSENPKESFPEDVSPLEIRRCYFRYIHSFANQLGFARDSPGTQLNLPFVMFPGNGMCCTRLPHVSVATIFEMYMYRDISNIATECAAPSHLMFKLLRYSRYRDTVYRRITLLIRLLKILRQPTTGFALFGANQVGACKHHKREIQLGSRTQANVDTSANPTTQIALMSKNFPQPYVWCITSIHLSRYLEYRSNWNMRRPGAAHSVAWKHHKREIQLDSRREPRVSVLLATQFGQTLTNTLICKSIRFSRDTQTPLSSVQLYSLELTNDVRHLWVFQHRYLRSFGEVGWRQLFRSEMIGKRVVDCVAQCGSRGPHPGRLLKTLRQPSIGFTFSEAHQVLLETKLHGIGDSFVNKFGFARDLPTNSTESLVYGVSKQIRQADPVGLT